MIYLAIQEPTKFSVVRTGMTDFHIHSFLFHPADHYYSQASNEFAIGSFHMQRGKCNMGRKSPEGTSWVLHDGHFFTYERPYSQFESIHNRSLCLHFL